MVIQRPDGADRLQAEKSPESAPAAAAAPAPAALTPVDTVSSSSSTSSAFLAHVVLPEDSSVVSSYSVCQVWQMVLDPAWHSDQLSTSHCTPQTVFPKTNQYCKIYQRNL